MVMNRQTAVIVPVYNDVCALELVLAGYRRQGWIDFELVIADDGSGPEVRSMIDAFSRGAPFPVLYIYQPDEGFRKCHVINQAVLATEATYLIFADADCVPHRNFVAAHWQHRQSRTVLCGRRVNLGPDVTARLTPPDVWAGELERIGLSSLLQALRGRIGHWDEGLRLGNRTLHAWVNRKAPTLLGSNFSLEKSLFEEVNGYDEDLQGYGGEDTDLDYRLRLAGARFSWVRHRAIQYHLYHQSRTSSRTNAEILQRTRTLGIAACAHGLRRESTATPVDPRTEVPEVCSDEETS
jgi:glycosyltransferase involved in cell wall biosynthesis